MKSDANKPRKQGQSVRSKNKPKCGTLSYLAECRGMTQKIAAPLRAAPPEIIERNIRRYPAAP
jgi:hypothetical protein